jgi:hypothetical protein
MPKEVKPQPCALCHHDPELDWNSHTYYWECKTAGCPMGNVVTAGNPVEKATKAWNAEQKRGAETPDEIDRHNL